MFKVLIIDGLTGYEVIELKGVPRIGDAIPIFYKPFPRVNGVSWLPEKLDPAFEGLGLDLVVTVK